VEDITTTGVEDNIVTFHPKKHAHIMLTQVNAKQGLLKYGEKGSQAISKEFQQLHNTQALLPIGKEDMSYQKRKRALKYLMFLKKKHDRTIKAQGCADG